MEKATIRLFKAIEIASSRKKNPSKKLLEETIKRGFIFAPEVVANCSDIIGLIKIVEEEIGLTGEQLNKSFHKSWAKIKDASIMQLVMEQIVHYMTTYGFEELGIYDENSVYIPNEKLELPEELHENFKLTIIKGYTKKELKEKLLNLLSSGIALKEDTIKDVVEVANSVKLKEKEIKEIRNKEVQMILYSSMGLFPEHPQEFVRFLIYKTLKQSLLIKSKALLGELKEADVSVIYPLLIKYEKKHNLKRLAEVFYRFKPIFLSFRNAGINKPIINKIRRLAKKNHKPMPEDYLNSITSKIKRDIKIDKEELLKELKKVNTFRKIRLAYALKYRTQDADAILYKIRNGKGYATEWAFTNRAAAKKVLDIVLNSIVEDVKKNVNKKKIYIPEFMNYTLPATEKQFTGDFPSGTYIDIKSDMIVGIYWNNVKSHRIDLDLSLLSVDKKIGWDSSYRTEEKDVLFSGDMTTAHKGASELFYMKRQAKNPYLMSLNYYNHNPSIEVPFKIIVAKEKLTKMEMNYMVDINNVLSIAKTKTNKKQTILGLIVPTTTGNRFYFSETSIGNGITASNSDFMSNTRKYLINFYTNTIKLKSILEKAGAKIVKDVDKCDIDLSPENLEKDTILNLLK